MGSAASNYETGAVASRVNSKVIGIDLQKANKLFTIKAIFPGV